MNAVDFVDVFLRVVALLGVMWLTGNFGIERTRDYDDES